jgi:hypothetical protein
MIPIGLLDNVLKLLLDGPVAHHVDARGHDRRDRRHYRRNSSDAVPTSLFKRTDCLLPLTTTLIVPETPYSLLWKLPR